jgi:DnaK suppressor protein
VAKKAAPAKVAPAKASKPVAKPAAKPVAKKAAPVKPTPAKAQAKAPVKAPVQAAVKPAAKAPSKPTTPVAAAAPVSKKIEAKPVQSTASAVAPVESAVFKSTMPLPVLQSISPTVKKDPKRANHWKTKPLEQLVDEDIIAMSDDEYMNDVQMAYFRRKLVQLKEGILVNAGQTTENLREDTVIVPDPADRATIEEEHALELRTRDRERKLLKKIEQSIERIDAGEYGYCDETGEPIGVPRLLARPTASLSLEAQQRRELKQKMYGD